MKYKYVLLIRIKVCKCMSILSDVHEKYLTDKPNEFTVSTTPFFFLNTFIKCDKKGPKNII